MFGSLSFNEILFIMVLALLIFGPKRLPQIGRTVGKTLGEFRRATSDLKRSMEVEMTMAEERETAAGDPPTRIVDGTEARRAPETAPDGESAPASGPRPVESAEGGEPAGAAVTAAASGVATESEDRPDGEADAGSTPPPAGDDTAEPTDDEAYGTGPSGGRDRRVAREPIDGS